MRRGKILLLSVLLMGFVIFGLQSSTARAEDLMTAHWKFNELVAGTAEDSMGNYDATPSGDPTPDEDVPSLGFSNPRSINLDGSDYFNADRPVEDDMTICAWIKTTSVGISTNHYQSAAIFEAEQISLTNDFGFGIDSDGKLMFGNGGELGDQTVRSTGSVNNGEWRHVCVTRNANTGEIILYIDGTQDGSGTGNNGTLDASNIVNIGYGGDGGTSINGKIDDLRVYNFVLNSSQIETLANGNNYPAIQMLCSETQPTATSLSAECEVQAEIGFGDLGETTWQARYHKVGSPTWTTIDDFDNTQGKVSITGLEPETEYEIGLTPTNNFFNEEGLLTGTTLSLDSDVDDDGALDVEENNAPNNGDVNKDEILDALQSHVVGFVNDVTGAYSALEVSSDCSVARVEVVAEDGVDDRGDDNYKYPGGLMDFHIDCGIEGYTADITQYYFGVEADDNFVLRKYKPATGYFSVDSAEIETQSIGDEQVTIASYQITDGTNLDIDGLEDGGIEDPAGLATSAEELANTGEDVTGLTTIAILLVVLPFFGLALSRQKTESTQD